MFLPVILHSFHFWFAENTFETLIFGGRLSWSLAITLDSLLCAPLPEMSQIWFIMIKLLDVALFNQIIIYNAIDRRCLRTHPLRSLAYSLIGFGACLRYCCFGPWRRSLGDFLAFVASAEGRKILNFVEVDSGTFVEDCLLHRFLQSLLCFRSCFTINHFQFASRLRILMSLRQFSLKFRSALCKMLSLDRDP